MHIDRETWYPEGSPELEVLGKRQTRARHRCEGRGCPYHKAGSRVIYFGGDMLDYLAANRVEPGKAA